MGKKRGEFESSKRQWVRLVLVDVFLRVAQFLCLCLSVFVSLTLSVSVNVFLRVSVSLSVFSCVSDILSSCLSSSPSVYIFLYLSIHLSVSLNTSLSVSEFADLSMVHCLPPHNCLEIRTIDRVLQVALTR